MPKRRPDAPTRENPEITLRQFKQSRPAWEVLAAYGVAVRRRSPQKALTRDFKGTVRALIQKDAKYRRELRREAAGCLLAGDPDTGKAILRTLAEAAKRKKRRG